MLRALWEALKRRNVKPTSFLATYNTRLGEASDRNERGGGVGRDAISPPPPS